MIRGVNKHIIEVVNTEDDIFEKAILFVKAEKSDLDNAEIIKEADRFVKRIGNPKKKKLIRKKAIMFWIKFSAAIIFISLIAFIILKLLF